MPPLGPVPPSPRERDAFLAFAGAWERLRYDPTAPAHPGAPVLRRLTRREVANSLRDVLGIDVDAVAALPEESVAAGFDHLGSAQSLPPVAVERWIDFAQLAAAEAAPRAAAGPDWTAPRERRDGADLAGGNGGELYSNGDLVWSYDFPRGGTYRLRAALAGDQAGPDPARAALRLGRAEVLRTDVTARRSAAPDRIEVDVVVDKPGTHDVAVRFLNDYWRPDDPDPRQRDRNLIALWIEVEGPLDPPDASPLERELAARFGDLGGVEAQRAALAYLGLRLWRRPLETRELDALLVHAKGPDEWLATGLFALIASPNFLFRVELSSDYERDVEGYEMATRLSYLLWSSAPDPALLDAAARGELATRAGRAASVARMLDDARGRAIARDFGFQWLQLTRLESRVPTEPPERAELLRSMLVESERFLDEALRGGRPLIELLTAERTFVDGRLARHYGIDAPAGDEFLPVDLVGAGRPGILGRAAVLTATSEPARTSPVSRGAFVLDALLGDAPPPPPPEIPALDTRPGADGGLDLVARLAQHRAEPSCAVCHDTMDPLGLALEGFGPLGERRAGAPGRGSLPDGTELLGLEGLVEELLGDGRFLRTFVERLFVYALGRSLESADRGEVARIVAGLDPGSATFLDVVLALVETPAFLRRSAGP
ncbi:MAG: DUF1592 domain-containing protein [Planctomycetaceae bacterium]|nr:DUF1592 domain-containing protein [Planctomycetaceae bacterium]